MDKTQNPLQIIIFGATGDLVKKKIAAALYLLFLENKLPENFNVLGVARRDWNHETFANYIIDTIEDKLGKQDPDLLHKFCKKLHYISGDFGDYGTYEEAKEFMIQKTEEYGECPNKLIYLSTPPEYYDTLMENIKKSGFHLYCERDDGWERIVVEKPFGSDYESALSLNSKLLELFTEKQIFRIDHYLGKDIIRSIPSLRFDNNFVEDWLNKEHVEKIEITTNETNDVSDRGAFYDKNGTLKDVGQNHLLEMLALLTMEEPENDDGIVEERTKLLQSLNQLSKEDIKNNTYREQYDGYLEVDGVKPNSNTETFFKIKCFINNDRWKGVPIHLEAGKVRQVTQKFVKITFKEDSKLNTLIISLEPKVEISYTLDLDGQLKKLHLDMNDGNKIQYVQEYKNLLNDCLQGNQINFTSIDETLAQWSFVDPIIDEWKDSPIKG